MKTPCLKCQSPNVYEQDGELCCMMCGKRAPISGATKIIITEITGRGAMAYPNKIDNGILKKRIEEGKFTDEIAKEFGVVPGAVNTRIKRLGLAPNYRRKRPGAPTPSAPVRQMQSDLTYKGLVPASGQIIPVTLRLNVEVTIRVNSAGL